MTRQFCSRLQRWEAKASWSAAALFRPTLSGNNRRELDVEMVRALTFLSRWAAAWIPFLPGAITGAVLRAPSPLQQFAALTNLFAALAGVALKEEHLYFVVKLQPCDPIGGNEDRMVVCATGPSLW